MIFAGKQLNKIWNNCMLKYHVTIQIRISTISNVPNIDIVSGKAGYETLYSPSFHFYVNFKQELSIPKCW